MSREVSESTTSLALANAGDGAGVSRLAAVRRSGPARPQLPARATADAADGPVDPLTIVLRLLMRRWKLAVGLVAVLAGAGMTAGYLAVKPAYASTGQIRIRPYVAPVMASSGEDTGIQPAYQSFVDTQVALIESEKVLAVAAKDAAFAKAGMPEPSMGLLASGIEVKHPRSTELIHITFESGDKQFAEVAVKAIINAYQITFGDTASAANETRRKVLEDEQDKFRGQIEQTQTQIRSIAGDHGVTDLVSTYETRMQEQSAIRTQLRQIDLAIAASNASGGAPTAVPTAPTPTPAPEGIAGAPTDAAASVMDEMAFRKTVNERDNLTRDLAELRQRLGAQHPQVRAAEVRLAATNQQVVDQATALRQGQPAIASGVPSLMPLPALLAQRTELQKHLDSITKDMSEIGAHNIEINRLNAALAKANDQLTQVEKRLDDLRLESLVSGRVEPISTGNEATSVTGKRRLGFALAGSAVGTLLALGVVATLAGLDRSMRTIHDATPSRLRGARNTPLWGAVPLLDEKHWTDEGAAEVNSAVHRMRVRMQLASPDDRCSVVAITSPSSGDGKTSIATCLALSYSAAGRRTLLIDADVIGQGVTQRGGVRARPRLGRILVDSGIISSERVKQAVAHARTKSIRFGEAAVEMGFATDAQIRDALQAQSTASTGLIDALKGKSLANCITRSADGMYYVLPLANADEDDAARVSPDAMRTLLDSARGLFDAIIIDSGPILGSVEASACAAAADQVALIVRRGASRDLVELALNELDAAGAVNRGIIFNRATVSDLTQSSRYGSLSRSRRMSTPAGGSRSSSIDVDAAERKPKTVYASTLSSENN